jgi:hypothetical protein
MEKVVSVLLLACGNNGVLSLHSVPRNTCSVNHIYTDATRLKNQQIKQTENGYGSSSIRL